jgi:hypothetical protein
MRELELVGSEEDRLKASFAGLLSVKVGNRVRITRRTAMLGFI